MLCDLHTHSIYSDGTDTPAQLIRQAEELGLGAVALCDHNTVAGLPEFMAAGQGSKVEAVPGIEFSTDYLGTELHILGLFIPDTSYDEITAMMADVHRRKEQSNRDLIEKLNRAGYEISFEVVQKKTPNGQFNRAHIAAELTALGYTSSIQEAFKTLLSPKRGLYVPPERLSAFDAIRYIDSIGAVAVLAHPFLNLNEQQLRVFLPHAVEVGLAGIETRYPLFDTKISRLAQGLAEEYGLKQSGGSDYHGSNKPDISMGSGKGSLAVPMECLEVLRPRSD